MRCLRCMLHLPKPINSLPVSLCLNLLPKVVCCAVSCHMSRLSLVSPTPLGSLLLVPFLIFAVLSHISCVATMSTASTTNNRKPTMKSIRPVSSSEKSVPFAKHQANKEEMIRRAKEGAPFDAAEIASICDSVRNLAPKDAASPIRFDELSKLLQDVAHLSHKDWGVTSTNGVKLSQSLGVSSTDDDAPLLPHAQQFLERILKDGNWNGAVENRATKGSQSNDLSLIHI